MIATTAYHAGKVHTIRAHKAYIDSRLTRQTCILIYDFQIWIFSAGLAELAQKGSIRITHGQCKSLTPFNNAFLDGSWNKGYKGWAHWRKWLTSGQATDSCYSNTALYSIVKPLCPSLSMCLTVSLSLSLVSKTFIN